MLEPGYAGSSGSLAVLTRTGARGTWRIYAGHGSSHGGGYDVRKALSHRVRAELRNISPMLEEQLDRESGAEAVAQAVEAIIAGRQCAIAGILTQQ